MGSVHFWCNFLGIKKVYKVENQLLVDYSERRGRIGYYAPYGLLRLTPFPSARRRGPCKPNCAKSGKPCLLFPIPLSISELVPRYKKQKVSISRYLFALWSSGEGGILDQFVQDSYPLYMCLILQIIRSTMGYWDKLSAFSPSQSSHIILSVPLRCNFFIAKMHQKP